MRSQRHSQEGLRWDEASYEEREQSLLRVFLSRAQVTGREVDACGAVVPDDLVGRHKAGLWTPVDKARENIN